MFRPRSEVRCLVSVPEVAESRVRYEPSLVCFEETFEFVGFRHLFPFLLVCQSEIFHLDSNSLFVVHERIAVEFLLLDFERFHLELVFELGERVDVGI